MSFNYQGSSDLLATMNGMTSPNKIIPVPFPLAQTQFHNNNFPTVNLENDSYRFAFNNASSTPVPSIEQVKHSCFLAYLQNNKPANVGPFIVNVSCANNSHFGEVLTMDFGFINQDQHFDENPSKIFQMKEIQSKFESIMAARNILWKNQFENFRECLKNISDNDSLRFQMIQLPFNHFNLSPNKTFIQKNTDSSSQTAINDDNRNSKKDEFLDFMKQEIQLLKDQNELLKDQLQIKSKSTHNSRLKEYVARKETYSTPKSSRNISASSTSIHTDILSNDFSLKSNQNSNSAQLNSTEKEGSPLYEILQEYMLENEALRNQNNALNELRARHHSELEMIFRQNQNLSEKVKELNRQIHRYSVKNVENISPEMPNPPKTDRKLYQPEVQSQGYPIMFEKPQNNNDKTSYLRHYDSIKQRLNGETGKKNSQPSPKTEKINPVPEKSTKNVVKPDIMNSSLNDTLREELGRIDHTIKEHIRKTQFSDTLRNMGSKNNIAKK